MPYIHRFWNYFVWFIGRWVLYILVLKIKTFTSSVFGHDQLDVQNGKFSARFDGDCFPADRDRSLPVDCQMISARLSRRLPEVQSPKAFGVPFYLELVGRVPGRHHEIIVIVLEMKTKNGSMLTLREKKPVHNRFLSFHLRIYSTLFYGFTRNITWKVI